MTRSRKTFSTPTAAFGRRNHQGNEAVRFPLNGRLLVGVWKGSLVARLGPDEREAALPEPQVRAFDITGKPMTGWVLFEPVGIEGDDQLTASVERATKFVRTLPKKV